MQKLDENTDFLSLFLFCSFEYYVFLSIKFGTFTHDGYVGTQFAMYGILSLSFVIYAALKLYAIELTNSHFFSFITFPIYSAFIFLIIHFVL